MSKNDTELFDESVFKPFLSDEEYKNYLKHEKQMKKVPRNTRLINLVNKMQNYLQSAKEQLENGNKTLAAFYYGNANAIYDFLCVYYEGQQILFDVAIGNDFMFLDHELFTFEE